MLLNGDCLDILDWVDPASVDALVTDPPAGIGFMGKEWDHDKGGRDQWIEWMTLVMQKAFVAMKPGAHGLIWALPRTSHWTATALENAGFEVRDVVTHLFGSGFPKSLNISKAIDKAAGAKRKVISSKPRPATLVYNHSGIHDIEQLRRIAESAPDRILYKGETSKSIYNRCIRLLSEPMHETDPATDAAKQWDGWGTALKPASEHWILVRKPLSEKTVAANVLKWGTGGVNIDGCRIGFANEKDKAAAAAAAAAAGHRFERDQNENRNAFGEYKNGTDSLVAFNANLNKGRFPANLVLSHSELCDDDQCDMFCPAKMLDEQSGASVSKNSKRGDGIGVGYHQSDKPYNTERGFNDFGGASRFFYCAKISPSERNAGLGEAKSSHPTVKTKKLMSYLCKLITPPNGVILDPFMGSGSTGIAAKECGFDFIGIEKEPDYFEIAQKRIGAVNGKNNY